MIANRRSPGTTSRNSSSRLPPASVCWSDSPVTLPPGRANDATKPLPSGSAATANTIGITDVACFVAGTAPPAVTITSTLSRTNSVAISANRSVRPSAQRYSIAMLRPSIQPSSRSLRSKAVVHWLQPQDVPVPKNPITGIAVCCVRTASGHAAAAPPNSDMNSRRCIYSPQPRVTPYHMTCQDCVANARNGSTSAISSTSARVRLPLNLLRDFGYARHEPTCAVQQNP